MNIRNLLRHRWLLSIISYSLILLATLVSVRADSSSIHNKAKEGDLDGIKALLTPQNVNEKGAEGECPLTWASLKGHNEIVTYLIENGAEVDCQDNIGRTPLMNASAKGHLDTVKLLVQAGADPNKKMGNGIATAVLFAFANGNVQIFEYLIKSGGDINFKDPDGGTYLIGAAIDINLPLIRVLLANDVNINAQNNQGINALMVSSRMGYVEIVELLLNNGADISAKDKEEMTALMHAADGYTGTRSTVMRNIEGQQIPLRLNHVAVAQLLLDRGANPNLRDKKGKTALDHTEPGVLTKDMAELLKKP